MTQLIKKVNYTLQITHLLSNAPYLQNADDTVIKPIKPIVIDFSNFEDAIHAFLLFKGYQETVCQNPYIQCCIQLSDKNENLLLVCGRPGFGLFSTNRTYAVDSLILYAEQTLCDCFLQKKYLYNSRTKDARLIKQLFHLD